MRWAACADHDTSPTATPTRTVTATATATAGPSPTPTNTPTTRVISYSYDGLQRLIGATEQTGTGGTAYSYTYDLAGNRTDGGVTYNVANQITNTGYT